MKNNRWLILAAVTMGLVVGMLIPRLQSLVSTEAYARGVAPKQIQFVKTAIILTPDGQPGIERWQDPETKVFCYVTPQGLGFSCAR